MSRGRRRSTERSSGRRFASSPSENECRRCGRDVEDQRDWRPVRGGGWICRWCVSGADDE